MLALKGYLSAFFILLLPFRVQQDIDDNKPSVLEQSRKDEVYRTRHQYSRNPFLQPKLYKFNSTVEGDSCGIGASIGVCRKMPDCPEAVKSFRQMYRHNLERCSFDRFIEIVCCPDRGRPQPIPPSQEEEPNVRGVHFGNTKNTVLRKSAQACKDVSAKVRISLTYHIIAGKNADPGEFPHMAALGYRDVDAPDSDEISFQCGGALISERYVLSAAHCVVNVDANPPHMVRLGSVNISATSDAQRQDVRIDNITVHPKYERRTKTNDLALIRLADGVRFTDFIVPACLYEKFDDPEGLVVTGWGATTLEGGSTAILQKAQLSAVPVRECNATYAARTKIRISNGQICAADEKSDACQGDSGGPLQIQNVGSSSIYSIVGVTSFGFGCGGKYPGVYTRIAPHLDWIEKVVWP